MRDTRAKLTPRALFSAHVNHCGIVENSVSAVSSPLSSLQTIPSAGPIPECALSTSDKPKDGLTQQVRKSTKPKYGEISLRNEFRAIRCRSRNEVSQISLNLDEMKSRKKQSPVLCSALFSFFLNCEYMNYPDRQSTKSKKKCHWRDMRIFQCNFLICLYDSRLRYDLRGEVYVHHQPDANFVYVTRTSP